MSVSVDVESEQGFLSLQELFVKTIDKNYELYCPERELVVEALRSFCQNYESLKNVNVEDFLSCDDFQKYYEEKSKDTIDSIIRGGGEKHLVKTDPRVFAHFKKFQKEQVVFLNFLKDYWGIFTDSFDAWVLSSESTGYLSSHSTALILEQLSKGLSYTDTDKECFELSESFGFSLYSLHNGKTKLKVIPSYSLMKLLTFLDGRRDFLNSDLLHSFLNTVLCVRFILISDNDLSFFDESVARERFPMLEADTILRALCCNVYDVEWMENCLDFFIQICEDPDLDLPSLYEWHQAFENKTFEPSISPSLMFSLMKNEA